MMVEDSMFMSTREVEACIKSIKIKNSEGYDRIPQRILVEGIKHLLAPLSKLFKTVYDSKSIPEQWLFSKIIPVHKKGNINLRNKDDYKVVFSRFRSNSKSY